MKKRIEAKFRVFTDEHDVVFDSDSTSELGLLKHLEDNVCVAHEIDNGEYTLLELYLEKERKNGNSNYRKTSQVHQGQD